ncbi:MAG: T9SS type A sorting domain-containing protein [Ignavibacterium sp.]
MKKLLTTVSFLVLFSTAAFSQGWIYEGAFPDTNLKGGSGGHGVAVDPDGKVWVQLFGATDSLFVPDSGRYFPVRVIHVFNPNGTPASFSPIKSVTINGVLEPLYNSNRGLHTAHDGNILASSFDVLYKINYQTGEGIAKVQPVAGQTLTACPVADDGRVFTAPVIPGAMPIKEFAADFTFLGNAVDTTVGFSRSFEVSPDGNTIYWAGYTNHCVLVYNRPSEFDPFAVVDTIFKGFDSESFAWSPNKQLLWASSGSYNDLPNRYPGETTYWSVATWYARDMNTGQIVDSIKWQFYTPANPNERPRGIAFSPDYRYAYVTCFGASNYPAVQKFRNPNVSVDDQGLTVVDGYKLSQNYPNPFNPSTSINFELPKSGYTTLKIYDMLGNEVATLIDKEMTAGQHSVKFNAQNLASGTYLYQLNVNGVRISNKMILMK